MTKQQRFYRKRISENPSYFRDWYAEKKKDSLFIEKRKVLCAKWYRAHREGRRKAILQELGGKCSKCLFSDWRALQIDHVKGGGSVQRRSRLTKDWTIKSSFDDLFEGINSGIYQILCANCNWIKRYENNEVKRCQ